MDSIDKVTATVVLGLFGVIALAMILSVVEKRTGISDTTIAAYCDSLDAIAVKTPDGWECVTRAVIPADTVRQ